MDAAQAPPGGKLIHLWCSVNVLIFTYLLKCLNKFCMYVPVIWNWLSTFIHNTEVTMNQFPSRHSTSTDLINMMRCIHLWLQEQMNVKTLN